MVITRTLRNAAAFGNSKLLNGYRHPRRVRIVLGSFQTSLYLAKVVRENTYA